VSRLQETLCTARAVDLVEESFDVAIRAGVLADSTLIARSLGSAAQFLVAAPAYLKRRGRPRSPEELKNHDFLAFGAGLKSVSLRLESGGRPVQVALAARMIVNDIEILHAAVTAGLGIALLPGMLFVKDLRAGRLERVLRNWNAPSTPVHLVYPSTRQISPKVKSFVDHLLERMTPPPWEAGPVRDRRGR
jgi:DNA-binding transcriptional LysR family regulator